MSLVYTVTAHCDRPGCLRRKKLEPEGTQHYLQLIREDWGVEADKTFCPEHAFGRETPVDPYKQGIIDFVGKMSAEYRQHSGLAAHEDMLMAIAHFDIDPSAFYGDEDADTVVPAIRAEAELYKQTGKVVSS